MLDWIKDLADALTKIDEKIGFKRLIIKQC